MWRYTYLLWHLPFPIFPIHLSWQILYQKIMMDKRPSTHILIPGSINHWHGWTKCTTTSILVVLDYSNASQQGFNYEGSPSCQTDFHSLILVLSYLFLFFLSLFLWHTFRILWGQQRMASIGVCLGSRHTCLAVVSLYQAACTIEEEESKSAS